MPAMQYHPYGQDGPMVSALGFGVMRLPTNDRNVDFDASVPILRRALEMGVNFFDSHHFYLNSQSEEAIGKALAGWDGSDIILQTKTPFYRDEPMEFFQKLLHEAVEKLGRSPIDYLLFHSMSHDHFTKRFQDFIRFTDWGMKEGLIRHRGFSSHATPEQVKEFIDTGEFRAMLLSYNWLNPEMAETLAYGADKGMGVSVMNPMGGGKLAVEHEQIHKLMPGATSSADVGLRYVLSTPGVQVALSGMNAMDQLEENVRIASDPEPMTSQQRDAMKDNLQRVKRHEEEFCTACGYCTPCPNNVDIPAHMKLLHQRTFLGLEEHTRQQYKWLVDHDVSFLQCTKCGQCLPQCPNDVPIIERLEQTHTLLKPAES